MNDYERYGNALNPTPEQARNRRERREAQNARARAARFAQENERLRAAAPSPVTEGAAGAGLRAALEQAEVDAPEESLRFSAPFQGGFRYGAGWVMGRWRAALAATPEPGLPAEPPEPRYAARAIENSVGPMWEVIEVGNDIEAYCLTSEEPAKHIVAALNAAKPATTASTGLEELRALSEVADRAERLFDVANRDVADPYGYLTADLGKALAELAYIRRALAAGGTEK